MDEELFCVTCGADLTKPRSVYYVSGDGHDVHLERRENGEIVLVDDGFGETQSSAVCADCDTPVEYDDQEVF